MTDFNSSFRANRSPIRIMASVLFALFMREMQTRFGARRLGFIWIVFEPLSVLSIILAYHSFLHPLPITGVDVVMFMVVGIIPFNLMRSIATRLTDALVANQGLFAYRQLQPFDTFLARVIVEICVYAFVYIAICFFLSVWFGHDSSIRDPLAWLYWLIVGVSMASILGVLFAIISHAWPGLSRPCKLAFIPLYVTSGVFYPIWEIPSDKLVFILWNPFIPIIENMRFAMFENYPQVPGVNAGYPEFVLVFLSFIVLGIYRYRRQALRAPIL